jgi:glycosyltransferase EpsD
MEKILFIATVYKMHIKVFHEPYLKWFKENGYEVHVIAKNDYNNFEHHDFPFIDKFFDVDFKRSPFNLGNLQAYKKIKSIINENDYKLVHCHTPVASVLSRIAFRNHRKNTRLFYTAHGFHFFKGASLLNWLLFYPLEKFLSRYTDVLITLNQEDYTRALKFQSKIIVKINGVGLNKNRFDQFQISDDIRYLLNIPNEKKIILSVGELSKRKNHIIVLKALKQMNPKIRDEFHYVICGQGKYYKKYQTFAERNKINLSLTGFKSNISVYYQIADIFVFPSRQEGLPVALMEAMSTGLPIICSNIRGNNDLIDSDKGGILLQDINPKLLKMELLNFIAKDFRIKDHEIYNKNKLQKFYLDSVIKDMIDLYTKELEKIT